MGSKEAAPCLLDVVVFAGGDSKGLMPLSDAKNMLRICNRPLIWYCLAPWIEAGFRSFFLCVNEDYATLHTYLSREFSGVEFYFVLVPLNMGDHPSTTCDAVKQYLKFKESLRNGVIGHENSIHEISTLVEDDEDGMNGGGGASGRHSRDPLKTERAAIAGLHRDAILVSCDSVLAGVDVRRFVSEFYSSLASVSAMMFKPYVAPPSTNPAGASAGQAGGKKKGAAHNNQVPNKVFKHTYTCVAYEEEDVVSQMTAGSMSATAGRISGISQQQQQQREEGFGATGTSFSSSHGGSGGAHGAHGFGYHAQVQPEACAVLHRRLHFLCSLADEPELRVSMPFVARRSKLAFAADVVDAHVYLVRRWVLNYIAESAGVPDMTVGRDLIPLLARSQHTTVNTEGKVFTTPDSKIGHTIPVHWLHRGGDGITIQSLNAADGQCLPERADNLRVFCTIYEEHPDVPCRIYRVNTHENYQAVSQEIIVAKCSYLHLDEAPHQQQQPHQQLGKNGKASVTIHAANLNEMGLSSGAGGGPSMSAMALSFLLPDNPFTLKEKIGSQQMYIVGSFVESVPPPNTYITRSVIGPNVTLGAGARITDSVILGNVEIGAKAVIAHSVIGTGAVVNGGVKMSRCMVAPQCMVEHDEEERVVE